MDTAPASLSEKKKGRVVTLLWGAVPPSVGSGVVFAGWGVCMRVIGVCVHTCTRTCRPDR